MDEKFELKNKDIFKKLNDYIDDNTLNISRIITSPELYEYLKESEHGAFRKSEHGAMYDVLKYKNKMVIRDDYFSVMQINFVLKSNAINFNMPCVCGIYKDEKHP